MCELKFPAEFHVGPCQSVIIRNLHGAQVVFYYTSNKTPRFTDW